MYRRGFFYNPQLAVSNSNRNFLIKVAEVIGEGTVHRQKKGDERTRTRWAYIASAGVLRAILPQILLYMVVKKRHAEGMQEYLEFIDAHQLWGRKQVEPSYYEMLDSCYLKLKRLNRKGRRE